MLRPSIVFDNGSGYTKMGFSGNMEPSFVIPTVVALHRDATSAPGTAQMSPEQYRARVAADLDYSIGDEAVIASERGGYSLAHPVERGQITEWDAMERLWTQSFNEYLRVDPEEHSVVLTESPLTTPDQRETVAEIMFETFNVQGLYLAATPVLAFLAANAAAQTPMTGVVVDAGDSSTLVVPVVEGYVLPGGVRSIPVGGRHLTSLIQHMLKERGEDVPEEDSLFVAQKAKEKFGYTCSDVVKEYGKHEKEPGKYRKLWQSKSRKSGIPLSCHVGPERFMCAEALFSQDILDCLVQESNPHRFRDAARLALTSAESGKLGQRRSSGAAEHSSVLPLPLSVDAAIQSAPIDTRRALFKTVVLSGGSSLFKDFGRRLQRDVKKIVDSRQTNLQASTPRESSSSDPSLTASPSSTPQKQSRAFATSGAVEVSVVSHPVQEFATWFGGSILASTPAFQQTVHTREMYAEYGPRCCRTFRTMVSV